MLVAIKASRLLPTSVTFVSLFIFVTATLIVAYSIYDILKIDQILPRWKPIAVQGIRKVVMQSRIVASRLQTFILLPVFRGYASVQSLTTFVNRNSIMLVRQLITEPLGKLATTLSVRTAQMTISLLAWGSARAIEAMNEYHQQVKIRREAYIKRRVVALNSRENQNLISKVSFKNSIKANFFAFQWLIYKNQHLRIANETLRAEVQELNAELKTLVENWSPQFKKQGTPTAHRERPKQIQNSDLDIGLNVDFSESNQLTKSDLSRGNPILSQPDLDRILQM